MHLPLLGAAAAALLLLPGLSTVRAATLERDFTVGWVLANPDGALDRPTIGINGKWPNPLISANVGDRLRLNVHNNLGNASTSLHFHGLFQNGTSHMDGAVGVSQCPIPPGQSLTYDIKFDQPGTYWYHAHNDGQYGDGLRGPVVVHDPNGPFEAQYDEEIVITLSDWYHRLSGDLIDELINVENPTGAEPVPQAALMNDKQDLRVRVLPGKTYLIRLVNIGVFAAQYFWFESHQMRIVEVDGVWTEETPADRLYITPAQRYSILLTTHEKGKKNFPFIGAMDQDLFDVIPDGLNPNVTGWLVYDEAKPLPKPATVDELDRFDDYDLIPFDRVELLEHVDHRFSLDVKMDNLGDGANYAFFNDVTYVAPKVPSLYTALTVGAGNATDPRVYGSNSNAHVLRHNDVVEIILNNGDDGRHPFHMHGHNFQLVHRSEEDAGPYTGGASIDKLRRVPMRRDTVLVEPNGHLVLRFRADNPGVWLFHCHIEWHMAQGLIATIIEAPERLGHIKLPLDHLAACRSAGVPTAGNAAGHLHDVLDLTGENTSVPPLPEGFTAKGYVALFFSAVAAAMGMASVSWYGSMDVQSKRDDDENQGRSSVDE